MRSSKTETDHLLSIGKVSELTGIEIHTLRYWEREFSGFLQPVRTPGGQRRYDAETVACVLTIYRLLKREGYTVEGARRMLVRQRREESRIQEVNR